MDSSRFSYLEEPNGARARTWVDRQNQHTVAELEGDRRFKEYLQIVTQSERGSGTDDTAGLLAKPRHMWLHRDWVYQLWTDASHPRGIWRRVSLHSYLAHRPKWQTLLDMDEFSTAQREDWMFVEPFFSPNGRRCLLQLSLGGSIRTAWREFDLGRADFVAGGFHVPPSTINNQVVWRTDDTVLLSTDFGPGTVNRAGSPLVVKEWTRGQPLSEAKEILRGQPEDVAVDVNSIDALDGGLEEDKDGTRVVHIVHTDRVYNSVWWRVDADGRLVRLTPPLAGTVPFLYRDQYVIVLKQDWHTGGKLWKKDTVVAVPAAQIGSDNPRVYCVLQPERDTSVLFVGAKSRSGLLLFGSRLGYSRLWRSTFTKEGWTTDRVPLPEYGMIAQGAADIHSDTAFVRYESFLQPPSLYNVDMARNTVSPVTGAPAGFRTDVFLVEEREAVSPDGVLVPYSLIRPRDFASNGAAAALVVGYGSRGGTQLPAYSAALGRLWLEQGGVYALANIRGGQERGREWAVSGVGRQHTYEDIIAVTDDLIRRKVTAAKRIGFMGHSAGGLLGGVMLTQRPDLFGAVVLKAPVLDQFRMDQIALGQTAWEGEFGSPDIPLERTFLERTSPFQNLRAQANFPKPLIITSTTDETVSPAQARMFAAKMESLGLPFLFYETPDGGHGLTSTPAQKNRLDALIYVYLAQQLLDQRLASDHP